MERLVLLNPENASPDEVAGFRRRYAVRAVVRDSDGNIALLHVSKHGYYKLPGGGVEKDEDRMAALARECLEEIGCHVEVENPIGYTEELRKMFNLHQTSECYTARVVGEKGQPDFTQSEEAEGFRIVWAPYAEALELVSSSGTDVQEGYDYIVPRDTCILKAAGGVHG
ncbi:MAG: NUDIX domain-containing protein [Pseudomonadaceae bacterium]|nr:NUDIX domain-containing protein [Pseudomonadaceae bacterium]